MKNVSLGASGRIPLSVVALLAVSAVAFAAPPAELAPPPKLAPAPVKLVGPTVHPDERPDLVLTGWTADGSEYGYCWERDTGDGIYYSCSYLTPTGKRRVVSIARTLPAPLRQRKYAPPKQPWELGRDIQLVLLQDVKPAPEGSEEMDYVARFVVKIGVRVRGYRTEVIPIVDRGLAEQDDAPEAGALRADISPDGKHLGVLIFKQVDALPMHHPEVYILNAREVAAKAYNAAGLHHHKRKQFAKAAALFRRATFADPSSRAAIYNLACALARASHPEAKVALRLAIERHGPKVKKHARKDADFAGVRDKAWFEALTRE